MAIVTMKSSEICAICLRDLPVGEGLGHLAGRINHVFHSDCLLDSMKITNTCPSCDMVITSINGNPVQDSAVEYPEEPSISEERAVQILRQNELIPTGNILGFEQLRRGGKSVIRITLEEQKIDETSEQQKCQTYSNCTIL